MNSHTEIGGIFEINFNPYTCKINLEIDFR